MSAHAILAVKGLRSRGADRQRLADVAKLGNEGWSLYGAPWLQPVAVNGKPAERRSGENKPNPLPSDGKEGVDGSSPSEGFDKIPAKGHFVLPEMARL